MTYYELVNHIRGSEIRVTRLDGYVGNKRKCAFRYCGQSEEWWTNHYGKIIIDGFPETKEDFMELLYKFEDPQVIITYQKYLLERI
jgi:hypothetical protein